MRQIFAQQTAKPCKELCGLCPCSHRLRGCAPSRLSARVARRARSRSVLARIGALCALLRRRPAATGCAPSRLRAPRAPRAFSRSVLASCARASAGRAPQSSLQGFAVCCAKIWRISSFLLPLSSFNPLIFFFHYGKR